MNIVIPMAGRGQRFVDAGYTVPKMLIEAHGKTLLQWSVDSLPLSLCETLVFVGLQDHEDRYAISSLIKKLYKDVTRLEFVFLPGVTRGQAETVLRAKHVIAYDQPLAIFNIDTTFYSPTLRDAMNSPDNDGVLGTFPSNEPRFSYAVEDDSGRVLEVAEKIVISTNALTGMYHFRRASDFLTLAENAIRHGRNIGGEFYIAPLYNELIRMGHRFVLDRCHSCAILGTPGELDLFLKHPPSKNTVG